MFLNKQQVLANQLVRNLGYEPISTIPLCQRDSYFGTDIINVVAIKNGDRHRFRVSTEQMKILTNDLVVVTIDNQDSRYSTFTKPLFEKTLWVKKFARPTKLEN